MFSPPVYITIGDEYDKRVPKHASDNAKEPFVISSKRNPHILDATFDPLVTLSSGDPYRSVGFTGPFRQSTKNADAPPFRPTGKSKKSSGKGDYYGTFSEKNPTKHETEFPPIKTAADRSAETAAAKRNFVVNPAKKGTYGYYGLSIGKAGETVYMADPYEGNARKEALQRKYDTVKQQGAPFRSAVRSGGCFDESAHGVTTVYNLTKPLPPKPNLSQNTRKTPPEPVKPWVPGGALVPTLSKPYEYQEDPYDLKELKVRELRRKEESYKPWIPVGTDPYRYIYTKPVEYDPPPVV